MVMMMIGFQEVLLFHLLTCSYDFKNFCFGFIDKKLKVMWRLRVI